MNNKQRLKNVLNIYSGGTPQENDIYLTENEISISWLTPSDFSTGSDILKSSRFIKNGCQKSILLPKNSLIMSCRAPVGKIGYIKNNGMAFNQGCKGFIPKKNQNSKYWFFVLLSLKNEFDKFSKGTTFKEINTKNVKNIIVRKETIQNQNLIANFLEKISSNINLNIEKKSKKIELLKEYKEALIYETVTKGLDKNVEMKDSGVDWIGKIPNTWNIKRFKNYYTNFGGGNYGEEPQKSSKIILPCFSISDFKNGNLNNNNKILIKTLRAYDKKNILKKGILLIEKSGGGEKNPVGRIVMVEEDIEGYYTNFVQGIKINKKINEKYILFLLNSIYKLRLHMRYVKQNTGLQNFNFNSFANNLFIPLLSLREQNEIVDFLDKKTEEIDNEVKKLSKKVKLIEELKESIIYECVTGKLNIEVEGEKYQKIIESI